MAGGALVLLVLLVGIAIPLALWALVERETENRPVTDRATAERQVRHDDGESPDDEWGR